MADDTRGNLAWLLNTLDFIDSANKTGTEEIEPYADSLDEALTEIFKPFCNREENNYAIGQGNEG